MRPDQLERRLRERLDALGTASRAELLHVLMLPDFDRADAIGSYWGNPATRTFAELLIDCEEDRTLRAVLIGMLREDDGLTLGTGAMSHSGGNDIVARPPSSKARAFPNRSRAESRYPEGLFWAWRSVSMSAETPGADAAPSGGLALGRHRTWRALLVVMGILVAMATWYVLTVDAIRNEAGLRALQEGTRVTLAGIDPERGIGFSAASLKNVSVLPITVLGMDPVRVPSDWRVREMRLGVLSSDGEDPLAGTKPFTPQHLARGEATDVVIVWAALPCDAPRLADGTVSGPVEFRIEYSILGMDRAHTFRQGGGRYGPLSVIGCPPSQRDHQEGSPATIGDVLRDGTDT